MRQLARGILRDPALAEDVAQEAFLTAYRKARTYRGDGSVKSWLFRIGVRRAIDELRRRGRKPELALEDGVEPAAGAHGRIDARWDLDAALERLDPESRVALIMKDVEGMSYREVGEAMEWPVPTVGTKLHRARLALREWLKEASDVVSE